MFKHILVTLDGSELSEKALPAACNLLTPQSTLTLLNVVDIPEATLTMLYDLPVVPVQADHQAMIKTAQLNGLTYLRRVIQTLGLAPTITVNYEVCVGETASTIVERAQALHVDAIVMSTHGRSGLSRWVFGSVTQRVLSLMPCPVLVIPGQVPVPVKHPPLDAVGAAS